MNNVGYIYIYIAQHDLGTRFLDLGAQILDLGAQLLDLGTQI